MRRTLVSLIVAAASLSPDAAGAQTTSWFPMHVGNEWNYVRSDGANEVLTITQTTTFGGREVFVVAYGPSVQNLGLENYWSANPDGDVLISGFFRTSANFGLIYDPPIPLVDVPLALGKTWTHTTNITRLPDMADLGPTTFGFEVYTEGFVSVPAGLHFAYGIGQRVPTAVLEMAPEFDLAGRRLGGGSDATEWWTDGLGRVQYQSDDLYRLNTFHFPTPTITSTWGAVKTLYRSNP